MGTAVEITKRFWAKVIMEEGEDACWLWTGKLNRGRGQFRVAQGITVLPHRWLWERENGPIPILNELHHVCGHPPCVRPSHMECLTPEEHYAKHVRSVCVSGRHAMTGRNVMGAHRTRRCRACRNEKRRIKRQAVK